MTEMTDMPQNDGFYTLKGYQLIESDELTPAMQDYLEMICRLAAQGEVVRVSTLAEKLHVRPSSASKMAAQLDEKGYIRFEKYGYIRVAAKGQETGRYLLHRHAVIHRFLCLVNQTKDELTQTEKIEHFLDYRTVRNLERFCKRIEAEQKN